VATLAVVSLTGAFLTSVAFLGSSFFYVELVAAFLGSTFLVSVVFLVSAFLGSAFLVEVTTSPDFFFSFYSAEAFLLFAKSEYFLAYYFLNSATNLLYSSNDFLEVAHLFFFFSFSNNFSSDSIGSNNSLYFGGFLSFFITNLPGSSNNVLS
jgi:hypothetical protein